MTEQIWINSKPSLADAKINVEDRGYQFGDGVYEVIRIYNRRTFTLDEHLQRLERVVRGGDQGPRTFSMKSWPRPSPISLNKTGPIQAWSISRSPVASLRAITFGPRR